MSNPETTRPRRRGRRILLIVLGSIALLILLALVLAPAIGGAIAPGIIQSAAKKSIAGEVTVKSVSLSWFGKQRLGTITVTGADGKTVAFDKQPGIDTMQFLGEALPTGIVDCLWPVCYLPTAKAGQRPRDAPLEHPACRSTIETDSPNRPAPRRSN